VRFLLGLLLAGRLLRPGRHAEAELDAPLVGKLLEPDDAAILDHAEPPVGDRVAAEAADLAVAVAVHRGELGLALDVEAAAGDVGEVGLAPALGVEHDVVVV
jgi:hypothetical protein